MTSIEKLVMMANQIAANLAHEPDPAAATARHIELYWDPRMKRLASEHLATHRPAFSKVAAAAVAHVRNAPDA
jgi:formate dehydrogenase subunit delta